jgi:hypothetical protein
MAGCPLNPSRHSLTLFLNLPASVETWDQPQSRAAFKRPGATNDEISAYEGSLTISGDRRPPAIDNVHARIPTTNRMAILLVRKDSMSSVLSLESREEAEPEPASALATTSTPPPSPSALEGTASEGAPRLCHPIMVMLLTGNAITQSPQQQRMRHSDCRTRSTTSLSSIERWCPPSRPCSSPWAESCCSPASLHASVVQYSRILA